MLYNDITQPKYAGIDYLLQKFTWIINDLKVLMNEIINRVGESYHLFAEINKKEFELF